MKSVAIVIVVSACTLGCKDIAEGLKTDAEEAVSTAVHHARAVSGELQEAKREFEDAKDELAQAKRKLEEAKGGLASDLEAFKFRINRDLETLTGKLDRLQRDAVNAPANAKQALSEQAASLEARKEALQAKTSALGQRAGEELAEAKTELANAVASLRRDIDQALEELGNNTNHSTTWVAP